MNNIEIIQLEKSLWLMAEQRFNEKAIYPHNLKVELVRGLDNLVLSISGIFLVKKYYMSHEQIFIPKTWIDHLKETLLQKRWLPYWIKKRIHVNKEQITVTTNHYKTCPHIKEQKKMKHHYEWLTDLSMDAGPHKKIDPTYYA